ncbi:hypothetical protein D0T84_19475 [Dysgonomonas sp. 521]|nr:hypothetical protein [Dysgonomonas sp. 521]
MSKYIKNSSPEKTIRTFYSDNLHTNHIHSLPPKKSSLPNPFLLSFVLSETTKGKSKRKQL